MRKQTTTTTEGVGNGAVERYIPRIKNNQVRLENIVNLNEIKIVERMRVVFGEEYLPVGDAFKEDFQRFLDRSFLGRK